jgi:hypothetical protein
LQLTRPARHHIDGYKSTGLVGQLARHTT